jgi:hypothetical protein
MDSLPQTPTPLKAATAVGAGPRFLAKVVDLALVVGSGYFVFYSVSKDIGTVWIFFGWLFYNWLMIATRGATLGKMMVGAVVVSKGDVPCGWARSLGRVLLEYLYLFPLVWLLSVIIFLFDKANRTPLDHTAGTRVVKRQDIPQLATRARLHITKSVGFRLAACALLSLATAIGWLTEGSVPPLKWDNFLPGLLCGIVWSFALLFIVPWLARVLWRFFLDRIADVSKAVKGQR